MKWYCFPSDIFFMTALLVLGLFLFCERKKDWAMDFKSRLCKNKSGRVCVVIIAVYFLIGFLDSWHFKLNDQGMSSGHIVSALDIMVSKVYRGVRMENGTLNIQIEEGYSKPMADTLYNPNIEITDDLSAHTVKYAALHEPGAHILGTDKAGGDIFYKVLKGIRTGVIVGLVTPLLSFPLALLMGCLAGYFGRFIDDAVQSIYTLISSIPGILLIIALVMILDAQFQVHSIKDILIKDDLRVLGLCAILGLLGWTGLCRLIRAEVYKLKTMSFIEASQMMNVAWYTIFWRHLLPNLVPLMVISFVLSFSNLVMVESILQFLQVGVPSSVFSWGRILGSVRDELGRVPLIWWPLGSVFVAMFGIVFPMNYIGDMLRDSLDVRLRDET